MEKKRLRNRLRPERRPFLRKPEFALTGIVAGGAGGLVISVIMEVALGKAEQIVMLIAGFVGLTLGFSVEALRFACRLWRWKVAKKTLLESQASEPPDLK